MVERRAKNQQKIFIGLDHYASFHDGNQLVDLEHWQCQAIGYSSCNVGQLNSIILVGYNSRRYAHALRNCYF